jgi:N-acetyl-anhydromuramyl-L-alanine amidase AmpD
MIRNTGGWKRITVHHSAEAEPAPLDGSAESSAAALRLIQRSHLKSKMPPWGDIGYHFVIDPAGRVFQGRDMAWQGAHAKGDNNVQNIGICLLGNFDEEHPSAAELASLRQLLDGLRKTYHIPRSEVHKHSEFRNTDCPGKFLKPWVDEYQKGAEPHLSAAQ